MLLIGNSCISDDEARTQMALWSNLAAPLIMGNDLRIVTSSQAHTPLSGTHPYLEHSPHLLYLPFQCTHPCHTLYSRCQLLYPFRVTLTTMQRAILLNKAAIAVDQDPLAKAGLRLTPKGDTEVWFRELADGTLPIY